MDLTKRLALLILVPIMPMIGGAAQSTYAVHQQVEAVEAVTHGLELADRTTDLIHEIGAERTLTAAYLVGSLPRSELDDQRAEVDVVWSDIRDRAAVLEDPGSAATTEIGAAFDALDEVRRRVDGRSSGADRGAMDPIAAISAYSLQVTTPAIVVVTELGADSGVVSIDRSFRRLGALAQLTDQLMEGQAIVLAVAGSGSVSSSVLYELGMIGGRLDRTTSAVLADASLELEEEVLRFLADPSVTTLLVDLRQEVVLTGDMDRDERAIDQIDELFAAVVESSVALSELQRGQVEAELEQGERAVVRERTWRLAAIILVALAVVVLGAWMARTLLGDLRRISRQVAAKAEAVGRLGAELEDSADDTVRRAREVASTGEQIAASARAVSDAVSEMEAVVASVAENATRSASRASSAEQTARGSVDEVAELEEASLQVEEVVELISTIAGQTNLLALNATVEAARAGKAGTGFAVVAGEVKDLAERTSEATDNIKHRVEAIRRTSGSSSHALTNVAGDIADIAASQNELAKSFQEQAYTISATSIEVSNVASATTAIADQVGGIVAAAEVGHERSGSTNKLADELGAASGQLEELVGCTRR
jgi:hypothetical protein